MNLIFFLQRNLAEEAVSALESVHGTVFVAKNSVDLCKILKFISRGHSTTSGPILTKF